MSFGIPTDRYPDTMYKKFQTASFILSAFSEGTNLANNLKNHMSIRIGIPASFGWEGLSMLTLWLSQSALPIVIRFASMTL